MVYTIAEKYTMVYFSAPVAFWLLDFMINFISFVYNYWSPIYRAHLKLIVRSQSALHEIWCVYLSMFIQGGTHTYTLFTIGGFRLYIVEILDPKSTFIQTVRYS